MYVEMGTGATICTLTWMNFILPRAEIGVGHLPPVQTDVKSQVVGEFPYKSQISFP